MTIWKRVDRTGFFGEKLTKLLLVKYDCEYGVVDEIHKVYYEDGKYRGFARVEKAESEKIDLATDEGAGFLLACFNKRSGHTEDK